MSAHTHHRLTARQLSRRTVIRTCGAGISVAALGAYGSAAVAQEASPEVEAEASPEGAAFTIEEQFAFESIVTGSLADGSVPGALVGVWYPGRGEWVHAAGVGNLTTAQAMTVEDHVRIASNTKTFVATVILQLVDEGMIGLDDPLESYIPDIPNGQEITIRQVLGMTAGIYDFVNDPLIAVDYAANPMLPFTPEDALAIIQASAPDFAPGEKAQYSNSNYVLLGMIIEQLTGQPAGEVITERVLVPLGMTQTSFPTTEAMPEPYAHGYAAVEEGSAELRDVTLSNPDVPWTSGAMISTLADLRIWAQELAMGTLLSPSSQAERLQWTSFATTPLDVSYGLGILKLNGLLGHNGGIAGYSSWVMHYVEDDASVVVVVNLGDERGGFADQIFYGLCQMLFPDRFPPLIATPEVATPAG
jgi:D-alanyl-D-alanine carboxypeptidase